MIGPPRSIEENFDYFLVTGFVTKECAVRLQFAPCIAKHAADRLGQIGVLEDENKPFAGVTVWKSIVKIAFNKLTYIKDAMTSHIFSNFI
jgi:hypothetical protein